MSLHRGHSSSYEHSSLQQVLEHKNGPLPRGLRRRTSSLAQTRWPLRTDAEAKNCNEDKAKNKDYQDRDSVEKWGTVKLTSASHSVD